MQVGSLAFDSPGEKSPAQLSIASCCLWNYLPFLEEVISQQSWLTGEVPVGWRLSNAVPIYKEGRKEDLGSYRLVSLTSVPGRVMEQDHPECHHTARTGQPGDQAQPEWVYERRVLRDQPDLFYGKVTQWMRERLWMLSS